MICSEEGEAEEAWSNSNKRQERDYNQRESEKKEIEVKSRMDSTTNS